MNNSGVNLYSEESLKVRKHSRLACPVKFLGWPLKGFPSQSPEPINVMRYSFHGCVTMLCDIVGHKIGDPGWAHCNNLSPKSSSKCSLAEGRRQGQRDLNHTNNLRYHYWVWRQRGSMWGSLKAKGNRPDLQWGNGGLSSKPHTSTFCQTLNGFGSRFLQKE